MFLISLFNPYEAVSLSIAISLSPNSKLKTQNSKPLPYPLAPLSSLLDILFLGSAKHGFVLQSRFGEAWASAAVLGATLNRDQGFSLSGCAPGIIWHNAGVAAIQPGFYPGFCDWFKGSSGRGP